MNQNKVITGGALLILCCFFCISISWGEIMQGNERDYQKAPFFKDIVRRKLSNSALQMKNLFNQAQSYFFPPNLDFRGGTRGREEGMNEEKMSEGGGVGGEEKLKEAIAESMGKTKAAVEESAKSAAELATKTMKETKEKVKRSFSPPNQDHHHLHYIQDDDDEL